MTNELEQRDLRGKEQTDHEPGMLGKTLENVPLFTLFTTMAIAAVGFYFTHVDQRTREAQNTLDALTKTLQLNASTNPSEQKAGNALLEFMGKDEFLKVFNPSFSGNHAYQDLIKTMRASAYGQQNQGVVSTGVKLPSVEQWIYLGQWGQGGWSNRTLGFQEDSTPESLAGHSYAVRDEIGTVNVRSAIPRNGQQAPVVSQIEPKQSVMLDNVVESSPSFWWGRIHR
jgi:hypothetical protein